MLTINKFWVLAYDDKVEDKYKNKVVLSVFANNEQAAISKSKEICPRTHYEVYEMTELVDDRR